VLEGRHRPHRSSDQPARIRRSHLYEAAEVGSTGCPARRPRQRGSARSAVRRKQLQSRCFVRASKTASSGRLPHDQKREDNRERGEAGCGGDQDQRDPDRAWEAVALGLRRLHGGDPTTTADRASTLLRRGERPRGKP